MFASILKKNQNTQTVKKSTFVIGEYKNNLQIIQQVLSTWQESMNTFLANHFSKQQTDRSTVTTVLWICKQL